jgi:methylated-DNA-[protein]-cysteine S-methyltransferase
MTESPDTEPSKTEPSDTGLSRTELLDAELVKSVPGPDEATAARLRARLAELAQRDGLLDVAYRTVDSPVGPLLLAATEQGLVRVAFGVEGHEDVLAELAGVVSPRILAAPARLDPVARELDEYFTGRRRAFDVPLDFRLSKGFRREVLRHLAEIPYGHTESYAEVAAASGSPKAVRAVGTACATNPLPLVVPCHRVVRSDGTSGRYRGGEAAKLTLLTLEAL